MVKSDEPLLLLVSSYNLNSAGHPFEFFNLLVYQNCVLPNDTYFCGN